MISDKLSYLLAIAEEQNLTRAAKRLYISQPTLTVFLNRLEGELGVKLFDRTKSPVVVTEAGRFYIEQMKKLSEAEQSVRNDVKRIAEPMKILTVGIGQVRGHHWLPMLLPSFCEIHPEVNIQVTQGTEHIMAEDLRAGKLDVGFGVFPVTSADLKTVELTDEQLFLVAHKKYGLVPEGENSSARKPYTITTERLESLPFVIPQVNNGLYESYEQVIPGNGIHSIRTISVNNLNTGLQLTLAGMGVQLLSGSILQMNRDDPRLKDLDYCVLESMPATRKCVALYKEDNVKADLIRDMIRTVREKVLPQCDIM